MNIIGKNVRVIRERKELTQEQFAAKCNLINWEISRGTVAKIESNVRRITDIEVNNLALALDVEVSELFLDYSEK
ncbi:helix-turn-helix domain-containing protein [Colwellia sp. MB3u-55]|jgi:transcriptional regulator with XRE-family HTH domain|uniref:helix-turn-helix domain-containing protein n=1 Tax=Colwellia sp. MB3u-55 TaxID=2759810 RepID=UPI0015F73496|nr:helix-turn-helix transcriptional regulator [Colwellia sp. MB3u-55]MBA6253136.1 helix-turn-helix transcriptional regulator [Colwellia sp. MB3u-55]